MQTCYSTLKDRYDSKNHITFQIIIDQGGRLVLSCLSFVKIASHLHNLRQNILLSESDRRWFVLNFVGGRDFTHASHSIHSRRWGVWSIMFKYHDQVSWSSSTIKYHDQVAISSIMIKHHDQVSCSSKAMTLTFFSLFFNNYPSLWSKMQGFRMENSI